MRPKLRLKLRRPPITRHHIAAATALALAIGGAAASGSSPGSMTCRMVDDDEDPVCTPGVLNTEVTQANINATICTVGFTDTIRPPVSYTNPLKRVIMRWYGFTGDPSGYEFDHLISLELGGDPRDPKNLWPQPYQPKPGAREKDVVEHHLKRQVCDGALTLAQAQDVIRANWVIIYDEIKKK